jgi:hypothetical protein
MTMSLGTKLMWYLLIGVLAVTGIDLYLSLGGKAPAVVSSGLRPLQTRVDTLQTEFLS